VVSFFFDNDLCSYSYFEKIFCEENNVKIDENWLEPACQYCNSAILSYIYNKISPTKEIFDILLKYFSDLEEKNILLESYLLKIIKREKIEILPEELDNLFVINTKECILYLFKNKKINPSIYHFEVWIMNNGWRNDNVLFEEYFENLNFTHKDLEISCSYGNTYIINYMLNNKLVPTNKCFELLLTNYNKSQIPYNIDLLINYGLCITDDDILLASKHKIQLNDSIFTRKFKPNEKFFSYCDKTFAPPYNDKCYHYGRYHNINCVKKLISNATSGSDYQKIYIGIRNLKLDEECLNILKESKIKSKNKDYLISRCEKDLKL
jgi:hypothetical protein